MMSPERVGPAHVRRAQSCAQDATSAAREFYDAVAQPDMALVLFFCSAEYDLEVLALEMSRLFGDVPLVGCTTAGEIGPAGCRDHSLSGASFPDGSFVVASGRLAALQEFESNDAQVLAQDLMQTLERKAPGADATNTFALLLIDGLSVREETVTRALQNLLSLIPLVGGSAGDGLRFGETHVFCDGAFHHDSAVVVLVTTPLAFRAFKTQHFVPSEKRVVVTAADAERRLVTEIDGRPAADYYAGLDGSEVGLLNPTRFAARPVVVVIDGTNYVRSVQKANPDGSLTFYCAIEEGLVLREARGVDLVENLASEFGELRAALGPLELVVGFDCILRKLEIAERGVVKAVEAIFCANNAVGFNSYGEQYRGVHVNQTLTGIAIGQVPDG